jgi:hypothetical protein
MYVNSLVQQRREESIYRYERDKIKGTDGL